MDTKETSLADDGIQLDVAGTEPETFTVEESPKLDGEKEETVVDTEPSETQSEPEKKEEVIPSEAGKSFTEKTEEEYIAENNTLLKRIADKESFINVQKARIEGSEEIIKSLTAQLNDLLKFFETKPDEVDLDKYTKIQNSVPQIKGQMVSNVAVMKLRSAAGQLDLNQVEIDRVNRSLREDGYDADTIARSSDKSILYYIKSVVDEFRQTRSAIVPNSVPSNDLAELRELMAKQAEEIKALREKLSSPPKEEAKVKAKPSKPPVATPSGSGGKVASKGNDEFSITGEVRI